MRRYNHSKTIVVEKAKLIKASEFKSKRYTERFLKPNPYLTEKIKLQREDCSYSPFQGRYETRPGMMDLRTKVLERDGYTCQTCGKTGLTTHTAQVDHKKPMRRFKLAINANRMDNLQTICIPCHKAKTKGDLQVESPVQ
jgi:HNH endonuclease